MKILNMFAAVLISFTSIAENKQTEILTDVYDFKMVLRVPRVYDNMQSLGSRKYLSQTIKGTLTINYYESERPKITISSLTNITHKLSNGKNVTYNCTVNEDQMMTRVNLIGSNKTGLFKTPSVCFYLEADPSYNIGELEEDNSLYVSLSGSGTTKQYKGVRIINTLRGYVSGTLGCGCTEYGHVSPTRINGVCGATEYVDDVAAVYGRWSAKFNPKKSCR